MDDLTLRYCEAEMRYREKPVKSLPSPIRIGLRCLIYKPGARRSYVERLFEGFAFLMGRLR